MQSWKFRKKIYCAHFVSDFVQNWRLLLKVVSLALFSKLPQTQFQKGWQNVFQHSKINLMMFFDFWKNCFCLAMYISTGNWLNIMLDVHFAVCALCSYSWKNESPPKKTMSKLVKKVIVYRGETFRNIQQSQKRSVNPVFKKSLSRLRIHPSSRQRTDTPEQAQQCTMG